MFDGSLFHLVDETPVTQNELVQECLRATGERLTVWHLPRLFLYSAALGVQVLFGLLRRQAPISVYRLRSARMRSIFKCQAAQDKLGWRPRVGVKAGLVLVSRDAWVLSVLLRLQPATSIMRAAIPRRHRVCIDNSFFCL